MADWWQWSPKKEQEALTFAVVGVGRFGTAAVSYTHLTLPTICSV